VFVRRVVLILAIFVFALSAVGCGSKGTRRTLKQAKESLEQGKVQDAISKTKFVLSVSPRNIMAKRFMGKIENKLSKEIREALDARKYQVAVQKADLLLKGVNPKNEEVIAWRAEAKKHMFVESGQKSLEADNPMAALRLAKQALDIDPQFKPAVDLREEADKQVEAKIAKLMTMAEQLIAQKEFEKLRDLAQDILSIVPQNREVADLLRDANARILARNKVKNLELAKKFYSEGIYESALTRAEEVLKVEPDNAEAKELLEKSQAELGKPELRVTGFTKIKGMEIAHIEIVEPREKFMVTEGDTFGDFKVSAVDFGMKVVIVTYIKTGSQQSLTTKVE